MADDGDNSDKKQLGRILLKQQLVTQSQLDGLLEKQQTDPDKRLASIAVDSGLVTRVDVLKALSEQHGLPGVDLRQVVVPLDNLTLIPEEIAKQHYILPIQVSEDQVFLAMADPTNRRVLDEIEFVTGRMVYSYVSIFEDLIELITAVYRLAESGKAHYIGPDAPAEYLEQMGLGHSNPPPVPEPRPGAASFVVSQAPERNLDGFDDLSYTGLEDAPSIDVEVDLSLGGGLDGDLQGAPPLDLDGFESAGTDITSGLPGGIKGADPADTDAFDDDPFRRSSPGGEASFTDEEKTAAGQQSLPPDEPIGRSIATRSDSPDPLGIFDDGPSPSPPTTPAAAAFKDDGFESLSAPPRASSVSITGDTGSPLLKGLSEAPPAPPKVTKGFVLVVDDEPDIRRLLKRVLEQREYEVDEAAHGREALDKVKERRPDLILLDAMLPEVHGFEICKKLKSSELYRDVPIIMISAIYRGWRMAEDLVESYGVEAFVEKPFRIADVMEKVDKAVAGRSMSEHPPQQLSRRAEQCLKQGIRSYQDGNIDAAVTLLEEGASVDPLSFKLHYHLGLLYGRKDSVFQAIRALETAVDLSPKDFSALKNLAVLYQKSGFKRKSIEMWERAIGACPDAETKQGIKDHLMKLL